VNRIRRSAACPSRIFDGASWAAFYGAFVSEISAKRLSAVKYCIGLSVGFMGERNLWVLEQRSV
jgi:hypothetical protein